MKLQLMGALALAVGLSGCNRDTVPAPAAAPAPAPAPAAAAPAAPGAPAVVAAPTYYEEGATYNGAVITEPTDVNDYVDVGGTYYWHPTLHVWVHAHHAENWKPREGAHVYRSWAEHPEYKRR